MRSLGLLVAFVTVIACAGGGCASPAPLVRLEPRSARAVTWVAGRAVLDGEKAGIRVATAFEQQQGELLGVRVEIQNASLSRIEVSPDDVVFLTCASASNESCGTPRTVVDPEDVLEELAASESRARADAANEQALYTGLVLLSAVGDVASIASGHADGNTGDDAVRFAIRADGAAARAEAAGSRLVSGRDLWSNHALRRSTLVSGAGASGLVFLPIRKDAQYVWLYVRAGGQTFPFAFKQRVRPVSSGTSVATRRR